MRPLIVCDTLQIELTNFCTLNCSNCTRFCSHVKKPFFMDWDTFKNAIDSLEGYPEAVSKMTGKPVGPRIGFQGGEVLFHPQFEKFCEYAHSKFPKEQMGLWTTFPESKKHYREIICEVFGNVFLNSHERDDIFHHPFSVSCEEMFEDKTEMWARIDNCWAQLSWSPCANPKGGYACEMMGSFAMLFDDGNTAWKIEPGWWRRMPWDFKEQIEHFCPKCGGPSCLQKRASIEKKDDVSPGMLERLKKINSKRIEKGDYVVSDLKPGDPRKLKEMAAYKDFAYRNAIATRYGMFLTINEQGFWTPHLRKHKGERDFVEAKPIYEIFKERWAQHA